MVKILYVEDNEDNIYMLKLRLERKGHTVVVAGNGVDGVKAAKEQKPDLILMDVGLPVMDGYQATKIIKADPETKDIPLIMLTAHALVTDEEKAKQAGADAFETKPINIVKLSATIELLLARNQ